jgi:hypothetical protein
VDAYEGEFARPVERERERERKSEPLLTGTHTYTRAQHLACTYAGELSPIFIFSLC